MAAEQIRGTVELIHFTDNLASHGIRLEPQRVGRKEQMVWVDPPDPYGVIDAPCTAAGIAGIDQTAFALHEAMQPSPRSGEPLAKSRRADADDLGRLLTGDAEDIAQDVGQAMVAV